MHETHFNGEDMARIINAFRPEMSDQFNEIYPAIVRRMTAILSDPHKPVNLRTADAIVTAMGCPHVLTNGAVSVVEHNRMAGSGRQRAALVAMPDLSQPGVILIASPFRKWMERQSRHYKTLTSMYHDFDLAHNIGSGLWRGSIKEVHSHVVAVAMARRGQGIELIYPQFRVSA